MGSVENNSYPGVEIWKPIVGYEGFYEISSAGQVKILSRIINSAIKCQTQVRRKEKIMKPSSGTRYSQVRLRKNGQYKNYFVHRLVATAFCYKSEDNLEVLHKNNNKRDNHFTNLKWDTHKKNIDDSVRDGLFWAPFGWDRPKGKYPKSTYKKVYDLHKSGIYNNEQIGRMIGVNSGTIFKWLKTYSKHKERIDKIMEEV